MRQHAVPQLGLRLGHDVMRFGKLLDIVGAAHQWVMVKLLVPDLHHMQDDLRALEIVLVPAVVECFPAMITCCAI